MLELAAGKLTSGSCGVVAAALPCPTCARRFDRPRHRTVGARRSQRAGQRRAERRGRRAGRRIVGVARAAGGRRGGGRRRRGRGSGAAASATGRRAARVGSCAAGVGSCAVAVTAPERGRRAAGVGVVTALGGTRPESAPVGIGIGAGPGGARPESASGAVAALRGVGTATARGSGERGRSREAVNGSIYTSIHLRNLTRLPLGAGLRGPWRSYMANDSTYYRKYIYFL
jgi:hypothetical protein